MAYLYSTSKTWRRIVDATSRSPGTMLAFAAACVVVPAFLGDQVCAQITCSLVFLLQPNQQCCWPLLVRVLLPSLRTFCSWQHEALSSAAHALPPGASGDGKDQ